MNLEGCLSNLDQKDLAYERKMKIHSQPCFQDIPQESVAEERTHHQRSQIKIGKKIIIKGHHKTSTTQQTENKRNVTKIRLSPKKPNPLGKSDLNRNFQFNKTEKSMKQFRSQWGAIEKDPTYTQNLSCNQLLPSDKKRPLQLEKTQQSVFYSLSKDEDRISSKSKRKIQFTVFEGRKKSLSKEHSNISEQRLNTVGSINKRVPYPCSQSIVFDLFNNPEKIHSKSKEKLLSRQSSSGKLGPIHKQLNKSKSSQALDAKIERAIQKLWQFQIVAKHAEVTELQGMLLGYQMAGEPECKWTLMVIDEIFGKIRKDKGQ